MSRITKEQAQSVSDLKAGYTLGNADVAILNELAHIALASLEAEPVAYIIQDADARSRGEKGILRYFANISDEDINEYQITVTPLYTAPPAPVSVPDYPETLPCPVMLEPGLRFGKGVPTRTMLGALRRRSEYYSELEAMTPEQRTEHEAGIKEFAAMLQGADGNSPVIPDGWVMVPEEPTHEMLEAGDEQFGTYDVYRRMIEAAPKLE
ncbi:TPA: hypothetical protein ACGPGC_003417 [Enterobacter hormaechei]